jgi:transposase
LHYWQKPMSKSRNALKKTHVEVAGFLRIARCHVFFFDEGRFGLHPNVGRCWALTGQRPISIVNPGYKNFYVYSAVAPRSGKSFHLILPWVNTKVMSLYLRKMSAEYPNDKIIMIMDQAGWHGSRDLSCPDNISIKFLPAYSPELNPVERLWQWLRRHVCRNRFFPSLDAMINALCESLNNLSDCFLASLCRCSYL